MANAGDQGLMVLIEQNAAGSDVSIIDVSSQDFMAEVIEASNEKPVIVDFWAPWCGPCKQLMPVLEKCVAEAGGAVKLAKVNIDENQAIAAQLRVQSVPTVYAFIGGQPVDGFAGAQPESAVRQFVDRLVEQAGGAASSVDDLLAAAEDAINAREFASASAIYQDVLAQNPESTEAMGGLIRCLTGAGEFKPARDMLAAMTDEMQASDPVQQAVKSLDMAERGAEAAGRLAELEARAAADAKDIQARYDLALAQYGAGMSEEAIESLMACMRMDRSWNDDAARLQLLEIFNALGPAAPEVIAGRRKLSSLLFS
jgi:putative thioredoxin